MTQIYLGLGSNLDREHNLQQAFAALTKSFGLLTVSSTYHSKAVDGLGDDYYNLCLGFTSTHPITAIKQSLVTIEQQLGRNPSLVGVVAIDIDLLLYGDEVFHSPSITIPHPDILAYAHVLIPLCELAPNYCHPLEGKTLAQILADKGPEFRLDTVRIHG